jgi:hypothetical protein
VNLAHKGEILMTYYRTLDFDETYIARGLFEAEGLGYLPPIKKAKALFWKGGGTKYICGYTVVRITPKGGDRPFNVRVWDDISMMGEIEDRDARDAIDFL